MVAVGRSAPGGRQAVLSASVWFGPMGVLDDAIRQHLELKRKHGVAEEELQRQEEEALGPARRDVAQQQESTEAAAAEVAETEAASETDGGPQPAEVPELTEPPAAEPVPEETALFDGQGEAPDAAASPAEVADQAGADAPDLAPAASEPDADPFAGDEPFAESPPAARPGDTPPRGLAPVEDPEEEPAAPAQTDRAEPDPGATQEYDPFADPNEDDDVVQEPGSGAADHSEEGDADVLEDTPDFLQETPEHDRLWFEQKPPRDFDFD